MPGLPVHHPLPEFTQIHVRRVGDAIQPSHVTLGVVNMQKLIRNSLCPQVAYYLYNISQSLMGRCSSKVDSFE